MHQGESQTLLEEFSWKRFSPGQCRSGDSRGFLDSQNIPGCHLFPISLESFPILDKKQHTPDTPKQSSQRGLLQFEVEKSLGLNRDPQTKIQPWLRPGAASWARRAVGTSILPEHSASSHCLCFQMELVGVTSSKHNWKKKGRNVRFRFPSQAFTAGLGCAFLAQHNTGGNTNIAPAALGS